MRQKSITEPRCANGIHCVAYPTLGEPSKLSRSNPGPKCFACEERRAASELKAVAAESKAAKRTKASEPRSDKSGEPKEQSEIGRTYGVRERRRKSVLTCERGLRSALASGDEHLVRRWSRSLRDAETRLAWAERSAWAEEDLE